MNHFNSDVRNQDYNDDSYGRSDRKEKFNRKFLDSLFHKFISIYFHLAYALPPSDERDNEDKDTRNDNSK